MTAAPTPQSSDEAIALVRRCDSLPFPARARTLALAARGVPSDVYSSLHAVLDAGDDTDRRTALYLATARRDAERVENALHDPDLWRVAVAAVRRMPVREEVLARLALDGSPEVFLAVAAALRHTRRPELAARLLPDAVLLHGRSRAATLLPACAPGVVAEWAPRLVVPIGVRRSLARTAPVALAGLLADEHEARGGDVPSVPAGPRRETGLVTLMCRRSADAALLLLERTPELLSAEACAATLARPADVLRIIREPGFLPDRRSGARPGQRRLTDLPIPGRRLSRTTTAGLRRLPPGELRELASVFRTPTQHRWGAIDADAVDPLLALLPAAERLGLVRELRSTDRHDWAVPQIAALEPADRTELLRSSLSPYGTDHLTWLRPLPDVEAELLARAGGHRHTIRMRAWPALIGCAQIHGDPDDLARVFGFAERAWHDREVVRTAALAQAMLTPARLLDAVPLDVLAAATTAAVQIGDSSRRTHEALARWLHRTCDRAAARGDLDRAAEVIGLLVAANGGRHPVALRPLDVDAATAAELGVRVAGRLRRPADIVTAATLLRRHLPSVLDERLPRTVEGARLQLADPATRDARAEDLLDTDAAWTVVATRRTDLVGALLDRLPQAPDLLRAVPPGAPGRWAGADRRRWERLLADLASDLDAGFATRAAAAARITDPDLLVGLTDSDAQPVVSAALAGIAEHAAPERAVGVLAGAAPLTGARGRAAAAGLHRLVERLPAERAVQLCAGVVLGPVPQGPDLDGGARAGVGARKAAVRTLSGVTHPDVPSILHAAWDTPDLHRDVRATVATALLAWVDRPETAGRLTAHLGEPAVAEAVLGVRLDHRPDVDVPAYGGLVAAALDHPDRAVVHAAVDTCARWPRIADGSLDRIADVFADAGGYHQWFQCQHILGRAAGTDAGDRAWRRAVTTLGRAGTPASRRVLDELAGAAFRGPTPHLDVLTDVLVREGLPAAAARAARAAADRELTLGRVDVDRWVRAVRLAAGIPRLDDHYVPSAGAVDADEVDALFVRFDELGGTAAGLAAVHLLRRVGPERRWPSPWRDALLALRRSADPVVAEAAWLIDIDP